MFTSVSVVDAVNFTFFAFIFIVTGLRFVCRCYVSAKYGQDDVFVVVAVVSYCTYMLACAHADVFYGYLDLRMSYWCISNIASFRVFG